MVKKINNIYRRAIAGVMLFTAETLLTVVLFLGSLLAFIAVAKYIFWDDKNSFDEAAFNLMERFVGDTLTNIMLFLGVVGNYQVMIGLNLSLIAYFLFIRKHRWYSIKIPVISLSSLVILHTLKALFNRPRPLIPLIEPARGLSFPSGHAMMSATFFGLLIYFVYRKQLHPLLKAAYISLLVLIILSIGVSRIYLRVHYASDVIAGLCMGVIWLTIAINVLNRMEGYSKKAINPAVEQASDSIAG